MPSRTSKTTFIMFLVLLLSVLFTTLRMIRPYLIAVAMGSILAQLVAPLYANQKKRGLGPKLASLFATLAVLLLIVGPLSAFITLAVRQGIGIGKTITENENFSLAWLVDRLSQVRFARIFIDNPVSFENQLRGAIRGFGKGGSTAVLAVASDVPSFFLQLALVLISCFFLLIDGRKFFAWISDKIPLDADVRKQLRDSFKNTTVSVIWATLAAAAAQSLVMLLGFLALGVPAAFLAAGAVFIFAWIPLLGSAPVWLTAVAYLYVKSSVGKALAMLAIGLFTSVIDNFVRAWVLKGRSAMHPLVGLVAIFGGIQTFGITGIFLGPILAAFLIALLQIWPAVGQRSGIFPEG